MQVKRKVLNKKEDLSLHHDLDCVIEVVYVDKMCDQYIHRKCLFLIVKNITAKKMNQLFTLKISMVQRFLFPFPKI